MIKQTDNFDPYQEWLKIPPGKRPPDHYTLLGLQRLVGSREVIEVAAHDQLSRLDAFALHPDAKKRQLCQALMNEVAVSRTILTDPVKRRAYDAKLTGAPPPLVTAPPAPFAPHMPAKERVSATAAKTPPRPRAVVPVHARPNQHYRNLSLLLATLLIVVVAVGTVVILRLARKGEPTPAIVTEAWVGEPAETVEPATPNVTTARDPAAARTNRDLPLFEPARVVSGESLTWETLMNGCTVTQENGKFHIAGTTNRPGWEYWNGVRTAREFEDGDFLVSADFKVRIMSGPGTGLTCLRVVAADGNAVTLFYQNGSYQLLLAAPRTFSARLRAFGDETSAFHRMTLRHDSAAQTLHGWVDESYIGSVAGVVLTGKRQLWLGANTQEAGKNIDMYFENLKVVADGAPVGKAP